MMKIYKEPSMSKAKTIKVDRALAANVVETFVRMIRTREEVSRGSDSTNSGLYALGYLESMLIDMVSDNPDLLPSFVARTEMVARDMSNARRHA